VQPAAITSTRASVYPKYFGLTEPSFSIAPDPHYLFLSEQHKEALAHLLYGAGESGGFVLLTGEVGTGKTTVCRAFLEQLPEGVDVALILNPAVTANELLLNLCDEFRVEVPEGERSVKILVDRLNAYLLDAHAKGRRPVLIIDEAQNLRPKVLEQVRLLTNLETSKHKLLQIFLIGQPELRRMLERDALRQINQRITARFHLRPFNLRETGDYIRHRVAVAGVDRPLFTAAAIRQIYKSSGGVPRIVNILCDRALLGTCVTRGSQVTPAIVKTAAREVHGDRMEKPPRPVVRPGFAIAAALTLLLTAGWLGYSRISDDADILLADLLPGDMALPAWWPVGPGDFNDKTENPITGTPGSLIVPTGVSAGAGTDVDIDSDKPPTDASGERVSEGDVDAQDGGAATGDTASTEDAAAKDAAASDALPRIDQARFEPGAVAETIDRLSMPEPDALRFLLQRWDLKPDELPSSDPCGAVVAMGLQCERGRGGLDAVGRSDRPALLQVKSADGPPRFVVLGALDESFATLDLSSGSELVPIDGLESILTGDYILLWRLPPDGSALINAGTVGETVVWLRRLLAEVPASGLPASDSGYYDNDLAAAVRAFQASRGLAVDGIVGPQTLIQLENAVDRAGIPRLNRSSDMSEQASTESAES
jgi:general secretion pathway protein A